MNINHFLYFVESVRANSITKAANSLYISQSTISKAIRTLENTYNTELIDRKARFFKLTSAGEIFYDSAVKIVSNYQAETEILSTLLHSHRGKLTLGIPPVTVTVLYSLLHQYQQMYPEITLRIMETGARSAFSLAQAGAVDIAILIEPFVNEAFYKIPILESEAIALVSATHRLANYDTVSFSQLKNEQFLLLNDTFMINELIFEKCKESGFSPRVYLESGQWDLLAEAVSTSHMVTILPKPIVNKFASRDMKQIHLCNPTFPWIPIAVYHKEKFLSTPMRLFFKSHPERYYSWMTVFHNANPL